MYYAAAERAPLKSPNLDSVEGQELINAADIPGAEATRSSRDNQQVQRLPNEPSVKTKEPSHISSVSTSMFCRMSEKWTAWTTHHKIRFVKEDWKNDEFDNFMDSLKYPNWILGEEVIPIIDDLVSHYPKGADAQRQFSRWRDGLNCDKTESGDKYYFEMSLPILVNAWMSTSFQANPVVNAASNRRGTDTMIELAFQLRRGAAHIWRAEVDMVLPGTADCVRADAVAALTLPEDWTDFLGEFRNQHVFSWAWSEKLTKLPASIVSLSFEAKVEDLDAVLCQVQLTLFSSQLHRRALSLEDGPVFGAILNMNILQFYVSNWENDTVSLRFANEMKRWDEIRDQQRTKLQNLAANLWRKKDKEYHKVLGENDSGELELDEAEEDDGAVDIGISRKHEIKLLEDRINRGDSPPTKDGYPLTEVYRYIFDCTPKFQPCCRVPSVSEWARGSSQFAGYHEDTDSHLLEYTAGEDVVASADAVSSTDAKSPHAVHLQ